jgi:hypothetical protein
MERKSDMMRKPVELPERISLEQLSVAGDILIYEGVKQLREIISSPETQEIAIKAFNAVVNMQKYIVYRKRNEEDPNDKLVDDLEV